MVREKPRTDYNDLGKALDETRNILDRQTGQFERILELGTALQMNRDVDALMCEIVESARQALGFDVITLNIYDPESNRLYSRAHSGLDEEGLRLLAGSSYPFEELLVLMQERFRFGRCYFIPAGALDWDSEISSPTYNPIKEQPTEDDQIHWHPDDALFVPVETKGEDGHFYGLIWADKPVNGLRPRQQTFEIMAYYAAQAAVSLENARLLEASRQAAESLSVLHQVSQDIVRSDMEVEAIYAAIHQSASRLMDCEVFVITLVNEERTHIKPVYLVDRGGRYASSEIPIDQGVSGYVVANGTSLSYSDILLTDDLPVPPLHYGDAESVRSMLVVPMRLGDQVVGTLSSQSYKPNAYSPQKLHLLEMFASYAAIALDNARLFQRMQLLATTDPLTGIYNRRHLFELGSHEFQRAQRYGRSLAVAVLDIDHFKDVNDEHGHPGGDIVLCHLAELLRYKTRRNDIIARYGGEEFAILFVETSAASAQEVSERIRKSIEEHQFRLPDDGVVHVTASVGVAVMDKSVEDFDALLTRADQALYEAKHLGRNKVKFWHK